MLFSSQKDGSAQKKIKQEVGVSAAFLVSKELLEFYFFWREKANDFFYRIYFLIL